VLVLVCSLTVLLFTKGVRTFHHKYPLPNTFFHRVKHIPIRHEWKRFADFLINIPWRYMTLPAQHAPSSVDYYFPDRFFSHGASHIAFRKYLCALRPHEPPARTSPTRVSTQQPYPARGIMELVRFAGQVIGWYLC